MYYRYETECGGMRDGLFCGALDGVGIMATMPYPSDEPPPPRANGAWGIHWMTREGWERYGKPALSAIQNAGRRKNIHIYLLMSEELPASCEWAMQAVVPPHLHIARKWDEIRLA